MADCGGCDSGGGFGGGCDSGGGTHDSGGFGGGSHNFGGGSHDFGGDNHDFGGHSTTAGNFGAIHHTNVHHPAHTGVNVAGTPGRTYVANQQYYPQPVYPTQQICAKSCAVMSLTFGIFILIPGIVMLSVGSSNSFFAGVFIAGIIVMVVGGILIVTGSVMCCKYRNEMTNNVTTRGVTVVTAPPRVANQPSVATNVHPTTTIYQQQQLTGVNVHPTTAVYQQQAAVYPQYGAPPPPAIQSTPFIQQQSAAPNAPPAYEDAIEKK